MFDEQPTALHAGRVSGWVFAQHAGLRPEPFFLGLAYAGLSIGRIGILAALCPAV